MYYLFFDESGGFNSDNDDSIAGGIITTIAREEIKSIFENVCADINKRCDTEFSINDIHIAPLLYPDGNNACTEQQRSRFRALDKKARNIFAEACLDKVINFTEKFIFSRNKGALTGIDNQSRYGANLLSAIMKALEFLVSIRYTGEVTVAIAPRNSKIIPSGIGYPDYHDRLCGYIRSAFQKYSNFRLYTTWNMDSWSPGFYAADIACHYLKNKENVPQEKILKTTPDVLSLQRLKNAEALFIDELLNRNEIAAAYRFSENQDVRKQIFNKFREISDNETLFRETGNLINHAYSLIDKRAVYPAGLENAREICEAIADIAELKLAGVPEESSKKNWLKLLVTAHNGTMVCCNHRGDAEAGTRYRITLTKLMEDHVDILGRNEMEAVLDTRNRSYNAQFNNYEFAKIIDDFEYLAQRRRQQIPAGIDSLTGKMISTIGQAYAFSAAMHKGDVQKEYRNKARNYFNESMRYFLTDDSDRDRVRSVGYLATLSWEERDYEKAINNFTLLTRYTVPVNADISMATGRKKTLDTWMHAILHYIQTGDNNTVKTPMLYDLVTLLRIFVEACTPPFGTIIDEVAAFMRKSGGDTHPYELVYKWLGIAYMKTGGYGQSEGMFNDCIHTVKKNDFTVETIGLSARGLKIIAGILKNSDVAQLTAQLYEKANSLSDRSAGFAEYVQAIGGIDKMINDCNQRNIDAVARWLPFGYA